MTGQLGEGQQLEIRAVLQSKFQKTLPRYLWVVILNPLKLFAASSQLSVAGWNDDRIELALTVEGRPALLTIANGRQVQPRQVLRRRITIR